MSQAEKVTGKNLMVVQMFRYYQLKLLWKDLFIKVLGFWLGVVLISIKL